MSDPFCLALTVVPILSAWGRATPPNDVDDDDGDDEQPKNGQQQSNHSILQKLFSHSYKEVVEDWWDCMTLPCRPCASDCFFQLDEDDGVQVDEELENGSNDAYQ